jgi:hypothetical protein
MDTDNFTESELITIVTSLDLGESQVKFQERMFGVDFSNYETDRKNIIRKINNYKCQQV